MDSAGGSGRNIVFVPTMQSPYHRYGIKRIISMTVQGIVGIRSNGTNINDFQIAATTQTYQGIFIAVIAPSTRDIAGYMCDCVFDFYEG